MNIKHKTATLNRFKTQNYLKISLSVFAFLIPFIILISCKKDNEEDLFQNTDCDTTGVSYQQFVAPLMSASCNSCHSAGNINTSNYNSLKIIALDGKLMGSVNHEQGFLPMPQGQPKLQECTRLKLGAWVNAGAPDN
jgi:hypothetical protein